ncbi:MAG: serine/threonine protein kinase [Candidatus Obscuribacterales bacterium]|nr:serine/threonine protein kinase [Candidatus Obscuribacterales bacterium]
MDDTLRGTVLDGRYKIIRLLGAGGMGRVYEAYHEVLQRRVAVKFLLSVSPQALKRFERECQALKSINQQSIPEVYACGTSPDGLSFLVMELCEGKTLQQILDQKTVLSPDFVRNLAISVGECLSATHAAGLVHRDIKPSNIMVADDEGLKVKLLDFGIAHATAGDASLTGTNEVLGSLAYLSPEHLTSKELDARSDLFSLGCVMYRALSGADAVDESKGIAGVLRIAERKRLPLSVPPYLRKAIDKCLCVKIENRFASADELVEVLKTETTCTVAAESASKHFGLRASLATVVLLLIGLVLFAVSHSSPFGPEVGPRELKAKVDSLPERPREIVPFAEKEFKELAPAVVRARIHQMESTGTKDSVDEALHLRRFLALRLIDTRDFAAAETETVELIRRCKTGRGSAATTSQLLPLARAMFAEIRIVSNRLDRATLRMIEQNENIADSVGISPEASGLFHEQSGDAYSYERQYRQAIGQYKKAIEKFRTVGLAQREMGCFKKAKKCAEAIPDSGEVERYTEGLNKCNLIRYLQSGTDRSSVNTPETRDMELVYQANTSYCKSGTPTLTYSRLSGLAGRIASRYQTARNSKLSNQWFLKEFTVAKQYLPASESLALLQEAVNGLRVNGYTPLAPYVLYTFRTVVQAAHGAVLSGKVIDRRFNLDCIEAARERSTDSVALIRLVGNVVRKNLADSRTTAAELVYLANFLAPIEGVGGESARTRPALRLVQARVKGQPVTTELDYAEFLHNLGTNCAIYHEYDESLAAMKDAYQICQRKNSSADIQAVACVHLANAYQKVNDDDRALVYFEKASDACTTAIRDPKTPQELTNVLGVMSEAEYARALVAVRRGDIAKAARLLRDQEKVWAPYHYRSEVVTAFRGLIAQNRDK